MQYSVLREQKRWEGGVWRGNAGYVPPNVRQGSARTAGPETLHQGRGTGVAGKDVSSASAGFC